MCRIMIPKFEWIAEICSKPTRTAVAMAGAAPIQTDVIIIPLTTWQAVTLIWVTRCNSS